MEKPAKDSQIELKAFHSRIQNDHSALKKEEERYVEIPVIQNLDASIVEQNYLQIKRDVQDLIQSELSLLVSNPLRSHLVVRK